MPLSADPAALPHRSPRLLLLVLAGALVGAPLRHLVGLAAPASEGGVPWATFGVNVAGSLALGLLLTALARSSGDPRLRRDLRLGLGTGLLGAFTTYSALGTETALLLRDGQPGLAIGYALGSAVAGVLAAAVGTGLATRARVSR